MNIEEARKAVMDQWFAPLIEHDGNKFAAALDAYALAVLDEAEECVVPPSAGWDDEALRDRIQAL